MAMEDESGSESTSWENITQKWIQETLSSINPRLELDNLTARGLQIVHFQKGFLRFNFIVPQHASDAEGNWHVGAIATVVDTIGAIAVYSATASAKVTMDYNISYYSSAKIHEEVEMEAKVIGNKGKLNSVVVEVRRKDDRELIAIGKLWSASNEFRSPWQHSSKL